MLGCNLGDGRQSLSPDPSVESLNPQQTQAVHVLERCDAHQATWPPGNAKRPAQSFRLIELIAMTIHQ
jgi:hypothetical protein